jgi:hypothetical protein
MTTQGFFVLTGHALSQEEIARQVDIGYVRGLVLSELTDTKLEG